MGHSSQTQGQSATSYSCDLPCRMKFSCCVEVVQYCLYKIFDKSVEKIPEVDFDPETCILSIKERPFSWNIPSDDKNRTVQRQKSLKNVLLIRTIIFLIVMWYFLYKLIFTT